MANNEIKNPHDKIFRAAMQYKEVACEFLEMHLPEDIKKNLDFSSIITCPNTFVDEDLKLLQSDILFKATISGEEAYLYVLAEHQSQPDKLMPFRLVQYMTKIWDFHIKQTGDASPLPLPAILPLIFFTGKGKYTAAHTIWDLCGNQAELMKRIWEAPFQVINVNTISDEVLTSHKWSGTLEFIMRHRFRQHLNADLKKISININYLLQEKNRKLVVELLTYIVDMDEEHRTIQELINVIHDQVPPNVENEIMSLAEILKEEGRLEGELKGKLEMAQAMLDEGSDIAFVVKVTKLPLDTIKKLKKEQ